MLQREDETLKHVFAKVGVETKGSCVGRERFIVEGDVLYEVESDHKRLVVPASCRALIMHLAHTIPWSGHLGRHKTYLCTSSRFYWPSMYTDIQTFCITHKVIQAKTGIVGCRFCSSLTARFPKHQQASLYLSCCMAEKFRGRWICSIKAGRHLPPPKVTEGWCCLCWR